MSTKEEVQALVDFATQIVQASGDIALKYFRSDLDVVNKKNGVKFDPVTLADTEIEDYIRGKINDSYPGHTVIGEEAGETSGTGSFKWLIDPIDGTRGFVAGSPMWGTLLGLMEGEECVLGLMHQPFVKETYVGSQQGAFIINSDGKKQIHTSKKDQLSDAILCCTHLSMFNSGNALDRFVRIGEICRFSRFGTDCYGYALLAHGFVDIVVESAMKPFDIMPLIPIIEAAGGVVTDWQGASVENGGNVLATANSALHTQALKILSG
ncbi:MAG: histidinol phosphatase-like enzyme (inositol monophosphatase family) [Gammaproteobacteria bacterium]|jgi:histidinol phosphatase-like enzyme (inositol monophosphatase family)